MYFACNIAQLYGGLLHRGCYQITYGGSKSGVHGCLSACMHDVQSTAA